MAGEPQHLGAHPQRERLEVGGTMTGQRLDRFLDFKGIPDGATQRLLHIGDVRDRLTPGARADADERPGERLSLGNAGDEAPRPHLTSSKIASAPAASFLLITLLAISGTESTVAVA